MTNRLFVYGTLCPGRQNEHVLSNIGGTWEEASVYGYLKPEEWVAEKGYPGIISLDDNADEIKGYIFKSEKLEDHWDELDDFEGEEFERILIKVKTKDKMEVEAYIYILRS